MEYESLVNISKFYCDETKYNQLNSKGFIECFDFVIKNNKIKNSEDYDFFNHFPFRHFKTSTLANLELDCKGSLYCGCFYKGYIDKKTKKFHGLGMKFSPKTKTVYVGLFSQGGETGWGKLRSLNSDKYYYIGNHFYFKRRGIQKWKN